MSNILYVGIDVSKNTNVVCIMLPNGKKYDEFSVDNSLYGARLIAKSVVQVLKRKNIKCTYFGLEATSVYGKNLIYFLRKAINPNKSYITCRYNVASKNTVEYRYKNNNDVYNNEEIEIIKKISEIIKNHFEK